MRNTSSLLCASLVGVVVFHPTAQAAEIKVVASVAAKAAMAAIVPAFEKASGDKIILQLKSTATVKKEIEDGDPFDVAIINTSMIDDLAKQGLTAADTRVALARTVASLAIPARTPKPDISTPDKLKAVVLAAKSISYSDPAKGGASSIYFVGVVERLGIADQVKAKAILTAPGSGAVPVGEGKAEIGVAQASEIAATPGTEGIPILPADPKSQTDYAMAVSSKSTQAASARAFEKFLQSPEATALLKSKGLERD